MAKRKRNPALLRRPNAESQVSGLLMQAAVAAAGWGLPGLINLGVEQITKKQNFGVQIAVDAVTAGAMMMLPNSGAIGDYKAAAIFGAVSRVGSDGLGEITKADTGALRIIRNLTGLPTSTKSLPATATAKAPGQLPSATTATQAAADAAQNGTTLPAPSGKTDPAWIIFDASSKKASLADDEKNDLTPIIGSNGAYLDDESKDTLIWGKPLNEDQKQLYSRAGAVEGQPILPGVVKTAEELLAQEQYNAASFTKDAAVTNLSGYGQWSPVMGDFSAGYELSGEAAGYELSGYGEWSPAMGNFQTHW